MNVTVRYQGQLRQAAGAAVERVCLAEGACVQRLLQLLVDRQPSLRPLLLDERGSKKATILIFLGEYQAGGDETLSEGDEVLLLTPIAGGAPCPADSR